jgi:mono/diheme cytochrome c family protein
MVRAFYLILALIFCGFGIYYLLPQKDYPVKISLYPKDDSIVSTGKEIYLQYCASCHGEQLQGQSNWRQRDTAGYLPAPPHDESGHTWHHPDTYLFLMTKYGIEKMIGKEYPNNMPAYEGKLTDKEIIAVLSYIKSTWPKELQTQHDLINSRSNSN